MADEPNSILDDATLDALLGDGGAADAGTGKADDGSGDGTDGGADNWTPPTREEWEAAQSKIQRANNNAKNLRLKIKGSPVNMPQHKGPTTETDPDKIRAEIEADVKAKYETQRTRATIETSAVTALVAAGLTLPEKQADRLSAVRRAVRLLDLDAVTEDGGGLEDAIEEVRDQFPGLFGTAATGAGKPRRRLDSAPRGAGVQTKSNLELLRDTIFSPQGD